MEILFEKVHMAQYIALISGLSAIIFIFASVLLYGLINKELLKSTSKLEIVVISLILILANIGLKGAINEGARTTYTVKINDISELYKNNYKIIEQKGDIFIVEKE